MAETFDVYQFVRHLLSRWRVIAAAAVSALLLAAALSSFLPKKYTATAKLLILPPGSSDPRTLTAVSPVYLDSLRTFEHFASSLSLFEQSVKKLGLIVPGDERDLESLQRSSLKVSIPRNTKILEIAATWSDAAQSHALANFIAEQTVELSERMNEEGDKGSLQQVEGLSATAEERVREAEKTAEQWAREHPTAGLEEEIEELIRQRSALEVRLHWAVGDPAATVEIVQERIDSLNSEIEKKRGVLSRDSSRGQGIESERRSAWGALEQAQTRLLQERSSARGRGERLQLIDSGIVPRQPTSPNLPLNVMVAMFLAVTLSLLGLTLEFSFQQRKAESRRRNLRLAGHG